MKHKSDFPPFLWPWVKSFLLSFGATASLTTAFGLTALPTGTILWASFLFSGALSLIMTYQSRKWIPWLLGAGILFLLDLLARAGGNSLLSSVESLLYRISLAFNRTYYWGVVHWSKTPPTANPNAALLLVIGLLCLAVCTTVCRRKRATVAVLLCLIPLLLCTVARDTVPDRWCLWLLLSGLGLLILTGSSQRMNAQAGRRLTAMVLAPTLLATAALFWLIPTSGYPAGGLSDEIVSWVRSLPFWASSPVGSGSFTGDAALPEMDLTRLGSRVDTPALAMTVVASRSGQLYLRGRGYDRYDGKIWEATGNSSGADRGWSAPKEQYLQSVTITTKEPRQLLYFPGSAGVDLREKSFLRGLLPNRDNLLEYTFNYGIPNEDTFLNSMDTTAWLGLPSAAQTGAAVHLDTILRGVDTTDTAAVAKAIEAYVESSAEYSHSPSRMPEDATDFAIWFLEDGDFGYCVHFASAAAVLLRAAGIPARYVAGYCVEVLAGQKINVWERHAHAWVEYYQPNVGWMILDATPGSLGPDPLPTERPEPTLSPDTEPPTETTEATESTQGVTSSTNSTENSQAATQGSTEPTQQAPTSGMPDWVKTAIRWLLSIAAAFVALWGQYRLRIWARYRYLRRGNANRQALNRYRLIRLRSKLLKKAIPRPLTELAEKAKFSQHTLTKAELRELDRYLNVLAGELTGNSRLLRFLLAIE